MINPATPCAWQEVPSKSPNMPSVDSEVCNHHQNVARFADLDRGVDHQIIAGMAGHGDRRPDTLAEG